jgi:hypothetical protein
MVSIIFYITTVVVSLRHNLGKFRVLMEVYSTCALSVWRLQLVERMFSNQELSDMYLTYSLAQGNAVVVRRLHHERYPGNRYLDKKTFLIIHCRLREHGNFAPHVANRGRQRRILKYRKIFWMLRMKLLESAHERYKCKWMSLIRLFGECVREEQLYPYHLLGVQALCHYKITLCE